MPLYLPPELIENIIDQINDGKTQAACSLTCRAWAPIAQSIYFRNLHLGSSSDEVTRFLEMIHGSPHIALLPRSIILFIESDRMSGVDDGTYLAQLAPLLTNLLRLSICELSSSSPSVRRIAKALFPSLRELHFTGCTAELHIISSFFQSHPTLRTLSFCGGGVTSKINQDQDLLPLRQLQHFDVSCWTDFPLSLLVPLLVNSAGPLAPIERLELVNLSGGDAASVCTLISGLRHILRVLRINPLWLQSKYGGTSISLNLLPWDDWIVDFIKCVPLEHLSALRELIIAHIAFGTRRLLWVTLLLQKVQTTGTVETIRFQMSFFKTTNIQGLDWDTIKTILMAMPCLRVVEFELHGGDPTSKMKPIVQGKLEGIERKCILRVSGQ